MRKGHDHYSLRTLVACIATIWLWVSEAQAQTQTPSELALEWQAPLGCPDSTWAQTRIADHLGRAIAQSPSPLSVRVEIIAQEAGFRLALNMGEASTRSERVIDDARCEDLAEAATLMIALAVDESAQASAPAVPPAATPKPATDNERIPALQNKPQANTQTRDRGLRIQLAGMIDAGFLPKLGLGPALLLGLQRRRVGVYGGAYGFLPRESAGERRVRVRQWAASLGGCVEVFARTRLQLLPCADVQIGRVDATGRGVTENLERHALFVGLGARLALKLRIWGPVWVSAEPGLSVPLLRQRFVTFDTTDETTRTLHTPRPVSARGSLGIELHF